MKSAAAWTWLLTAAIGSSVFSQDAPRTIPIWPQVAPGSEGIDEEELVVDRGAGKGYIDRSISHVHQPTITVHLPKPRGRKPTAAMVICPGGGLTRVVIDKEGNDFAKMLAEHGVAGVVLKFRTLKSPKHFYGQSAAVADVQRAIRLVRSKADQWNIDPQRVGVFGFSAGGYLASAAATRFDSGDPSAKDPVDRRSCRPDFLGLAYPLITLKSEVLKENYQRLILGDDFDQRQISKYSNELNVTAQTPPAFVCHALDDQAVKAEHSRLFAAACKDKGVSCTTFFREQGGHGYGIRQLGTPINEWPDAFLEWLTDRRLRE